MPFSPLKVTVKLIWPPGNMSLAHPDRTLASGPWLYVWVRRARWFKAITSTLPTTPCYSSHFSFPVPELSWYSALESWCLSLILALWTVELGLGRRPMVKSEVHSVGSGSSCTTVGLSACDKCLHFTLTHHLFVILFLSHFVNIANDRNPYGTCWVCSSAFAVVFRTQDGEIVGIRNLPYPHRLQKEVRHL